MAIPSCSVRTVLLQALDTAFDKRSWHGPNLISAVRGVDARLAARRVPGRKTIWEQVLHAAYWKQRVLNKLTGPSRFPRKGSNWPAMPGAKDDAAWRADVGLLRDIHRRLRDAVFNLYHTGQIKLLLRLVLG
jgi:DinB family protein